jgi:alpha-D-ribose 1-methylphosphonate 5-triphosphate synthase subunit PhnG
VFTERQSRILFVPKSEDLAEVWRKLNIDGRYSFYLPDNICMIIMRGKIFGGQSTRHYSGELTGNYFTILARIRDAKRPR